MHQQIGIPRDQVPELRRQYYQAFGTTLRGLQIHHQVDADDYLAYVHDIPLQDYLQPQPELRQILLSLPQRRWIFTNADAGHAGRVLSALQLDDCFLAIIDIRALHFVCKPDIEAFQRALAYAGEPDASRCVLFDDTLLNLLTGHHLGFRVVMVGSTKGLPHQLGLAIPELIDLPGMMPELWERR